MDNNNGRAGEGSEAPLTMLQRVAGRLGLTQETRTAALPCVESQGGPRGVAGLRCFGVFGHDGPHKFQAGRLAGEPVGSCPAVLDLGAGRELVDARALAVGRLSAAADDAGELAAGMGRDALMWVYCAEGWPVLGSDESGRDMLTRAARCARLAVRLARQAEALRQSADEVQTAADLAPGECLTCGERAEEATGRPVCFACWTKAHGARR